MTETLPTVSRRFRWMLVVAFSLSGVVIFFLAPECFLFYALFWVMSAAIKKVFIG